MAEKEYIERGALIEDFRLGYCTACNSYNGVRCRACRIGDAVDMIEAAPAADVVEVVRCKDCRDYEPHGNGKIGICKNKKCKGIRYATDFCSYGERREQE